MRPALTRASPPFLPDTGWPLATPHHTFLADDGTTWTSWDDWNDDIGWMANATLRGYQITGSTACRAVRRPVRGC